MSDLLAGAHVSEVAHTGDVSKGSPRDFLVDVVFPPESTDHWANVQPGYVEELQAWYESLSNLTSAVIAAALEAGMSEHLVATKHSQSITLPDVGFYGNVLSLTSANEGHRLQVSSGKLSSDPGGEVPKDRLRATTEISVVGSYVSIHFEELVNGMEMTVFDLQQGPRIQDTWAEVLHAPNTPGEEIELYRALDYHHSIMDDGAGGYDDPLLSIRSHTLEAFNTAAIAIGLAQEHVGVPTHRQ